MDLGVDFSQHGGALTLSTIECWKSKGVRHAIVQYSERMPQHLSALHASGGLEVEAYVYLYWDLSPWNQTPMDRTHAALVMARQNGGIQRLWLDAEDHLKPFQPEQLRECIKLCDQAGMPTGIYTGGWWWTTYGRNDTSFAYLPLWDARYLAESPTPNLSLMPQSFNRFIPYGGWSKPLIWQWHNTTSLCGHSVDLNALELEPASQPQPQPQQEEDEMIRHVRLHADNGFRDREVLPTGIKLNNPRADFDLPTEAKAVRLEILLKSGHLRVHDGDAGAYAGRVGIAGERYGLVDVNITGNALTLYGYADDCVVEWIGCVGYFR